ncbi:MAG: STAS domain-containing protein [Cyclobacteriaceae bacterium]
MNYTHEVDQEVFILKLTGDLIGENRGPELVELANENIENDIKLCAIDISEVRFINSSGIGVLITILTKFRNVEGEVVLINPSEQVKKLLIITKLNAIFTIVDDKEAGITELKKVA